VLLSLIIHSLTTKKPLVLISRGFHFVFGVF
jgi:hypothetical protein